MKLFNEETKSKFLSVFSFLFIIILASCNPPPSLLNEPLNSFLENIDEKPEEKKESGIYHANCLGRCPSGGPLDNMIIDHEAIILSSNRETKFADWVAYKVTPANMNGPERKRNWAKDPEIDAQFTFIPSDYKGMSNAPYFFDRGHQAPLASFKGHEKWYVVNYLSNITPQKKDLNRGSWKNLESHERKLAARHGEIYVLTGPYYDNDNKIEGPLNMRIKYIIPSGYWKIISLKEGARIKSIGFSFTQGTPLKSSYCKNISKVSEIQEISRLKFFDETLRIEEDSLSKEIGCGVNN